MKKRNTRGLPNLDKCSHINVGCHLLPLAFGTQACSAGDVPKVPKAWELGGQLCSLLFVLNLSSSLVLKVRESSRSMAFDNLVHYILNGQLKLILIAVILVNPPQ